MKTRFSWLGIVAVCILGISTAFVSCENEVNAVVNYVGKVVYAGSTKPFANLEVKVTNGEKIHKLSHTDDQGAFSLEVKVDEIDGNYYVLIGDSSCATKRIELSGYGQAKVDLGTIEVEGPGLPTVVTKPITNISDNKATSGGNVTADGRAKVIARGVCWSKSEYPTVDDEHTENGSGLGEFQSQLTGLEANTTYYVRAYATNRVGTAYGEQLTLSSKTGLPQVTTDEVSNISATSATCGGTVAANSGYTITARGICWSDKTATPTINNDHTEEVATTGHFTSMMIGLERNTNYYVRAYAVNEKGTNYGETKIFTTLNGMPVVTTAEVTNVKATTATCGGNVTNNGGYAITARGVCWSHSSSTPTIEDNHTSEVADNGAFSSSMTGLEAGTTYYVRAYATNEVGTAYGESVTFKTDWGLPSVVTIDPGENITSSSIGAAGNVTDDGGFEVTVRGFVYSTAPYPSLYDGVNIEAGSGVGYFSANITGITPTQTTYYIRAYATNERGTRYGEQVVITPERAQYASLKTMSYGGYTYKIKFIGSLSWGSGMSTCANMKLGDYDDWFMPNDSEVQAILDAYKVWNVLLPTKTNLMVEGCTELWSSNKANTGYAHYYHIDCSDSYCNALKWLCNNSAFAASTDGIKGVFAVRKYRTEN